MEITERIAGLLREAGARLIPLDQLSQGLTGTADLPGDGALRSILAGCPDRFVVLERPALFAGAEHWPEEQRRAYAEALRRAGYETRALVAHAAEAEESAVAEQDGWTSPVSRMAFSLAHIAEAAAPEGLLRESLWQSLPLAEATMRALAQAVGRGAEERRAD